MAAEFRKKLCMRGYHVYSNIWEAAVGKTLVCVREPRNAHDRYMQWWSKKNVYLATKWPKFRGANIFVGLIFVVEGTHKNFCVYSNLYMACTLQDKF